MGLSDHTEWATMVQKVTTKEIRGKTQEELQAQLLPLREELQSLRTSKVTGAGASKLTKMKTVRRSIARVLTVINEQSRESLRKEYAGKKYIPLDLRAKKTRAIRRRLSRADAERITLKQAKKAKHFPIRK